MSARDQSLNERCARFGTVISRLELEALTKRQRQVAELRIAGLSLHAIGTLLGISAELICSTLRLTERSKWKFRITGAIMLIVAGCATPYQQHGFRGGYSDARIGQDSVLVSFKGNGYTSKERVQLYLLYRCAEVTRQYGYDYFVVTSGGTEGKVSYLSNYSATTAASAYGTGNSAFGSAHTSGSGTTIPINKYGTDAMIKMFKGHKPPDDPNAYDARETLQYLGPQLKLSPNEPTPGKD